MAARVEWKKSGLGTSFGHKFVPIVFRPFPAAKKQRELRP